MEDEDPRQWIAGRETAGEMLQRTESARPALRLPPPLHRLPLRPGAVLELAGPSPSCKSHILLQVAIECILPKEWNGVSCGGIEGIVVFFDLDCRFDVLRLAQCLRLRIMEARGSSQSADCGPSQCLQSCPLDDELFVACMRRFFYFRCYNSFEFLAALKTLCHRSQQENENFGSVIHFLLIDSIGAFYWIDRAFQSLPSYDVKRKNLSFQGLTETIVEEIRKLLQLQPTLVLVTKATIFGDGSFTNDAQKLDHDARPVGKWSAEDMIGRRSSRRESKTLLYREYMPSVWQNLVTHRIQLRSDGLVADSAHGSFSRYTSEWVQPPLNFLDKFTVGEQGLKKGNNPELNLVVPKHPDPLGMRRNAAIDFKDEN